MPLHGECRAAGFSLFALLCAGLLVAPARLAADDKWADKTDWQPVEYMPAGDVIYFDHVPQSTNPEIKPRFEAAAKLVDAHSYDDAISELGWAAAVATDEQAAALHNILGFVHLLNGEGDQALASYHLSYDIAQELGDATGQGAALSEIGNIFLMEIEDSDSALHYLRRALAINTGAGLLQGEAFDAGLIGLIFSDWGQLDSSLAYRRDAFGASARFGDYAGAVNEEVAIGDIRALKAESAYALTDYLMAWSLIPKAGGRVSTERVLDRFHPYFEKLGAEAFAAECAAHAYSQAEASALVAELRK